MSRRYIIEMLRINPTDAGEWYWRLKSRNGKILAHSEVYSSYAMVRKTAETVSIDLYNSPLSTCDLKVVDARSGD